MKSCQVTWLEKQINKIHGTREQQINNIATPITRQSQKSKRSVALLSFWGPGEFSSEIYQRLLRVKEWFKWNSIDFVSSPEISTGRSLSGVCVYVCLPELFFMVRKWKGATQGGWTDKCWSCVCLNRCKWKCQKAQVQRRDSLPEMPL